MRLIDRIVSTACRCGRRASVVLSIVPGSALLPGPTTAQTVPQLVGLTIERAEAVLEDQAPTLALRVLGGGDRGDTILSQSPASGVSFAGTQVFVTTRRGSVTVPPLVGMPEAVARTTAETIGLRLTVSGDPPAQPSIVSSQVPAPGVAAPLGSAVTVTLLALASDTVADTVLVPFPGGTPGSVWVTVVPGTTDDPDDAAASEPWWTRSPWNWVVPLLTWSGAIWLWFSAGSQLVRAIRGAPPGRPGRDGRDGRDGRHAQDGRGWQRPDPGGDRTASEERDRDRSGTPRGPMEHGPKTRSVRRERPTSHRLGDRPVWPVPDGSGTRPFDFLGPFGPADRRGFHGRERESAQLYNALHASRSVVLYGARRSGKTSVLQCGLNTLMHGTDRLAVYVRRGTEINESLRRALLAALTKDPDPVDVSIPELVHLLYLDHYRTVHLLVDDLDELLLTGTAEEQTRFFHTLRALVNPAGVDSLPPCKVVLALGEEHLPLLDAHRDVFPSLGDTVVRVPPMEERHLWRAVLGLARWLGIEFDTPAVAEAIVEEAHNVGGDVDLSQLQILLDHLWLAALAHSPHGTAPESTGVVITMDTVSRISTGTLSPATRPTPEVPS